MFVKLFLLLAGIALDLTANSVLADKVREKWVVDTDVGGDDAVALLLMLHADAAREVELLGVTSVFGNTALDNVVVNVLKTLHVADRLDVPVYRGYSEAILTTPVTAPYFGVDGLGDFEYPDAPSPSEYVKPEHAVDALIRLVNANPGEINILALGPLTNIAMAIRKSPTFLANVKQLAILGGSVEGVGNIKPGREFNFYKDPEANFIVFDAADRLNESLNKTILLVPLESINIRNTITMEWRTGVLGALPGPRMQFVNNAERLVLAMGEPTWRCYDAVAAACVLRPEFVTGSGRFHVQAETVGDAARGAVFVDYRRNTGKPPNTVIVQEFDILRYKEFLIESLRE